KVAVTICGPALITTAIGMTVSSPCIRAVCDGGRTVDEPLDAPALTAMAELALPRDATSCSEDRQGRRRAPGRGRTLVALVALERDAALSGTVDESGRRRAEDALLRARSPLWPRGGASQGRSQAFDGASAAAARYVGENLDPLVTPRERERAARGLRRADGGRAADVRAGDAASRD